MFGRRWKRGSKEPTTPTLCLSCAYAHQEGYEQDFFCRVHKKYIPSGSTVAQCEEYEKTDTAYRRNTCPSCGSNNIMGTRSTPGMICIKCGRVFDGDV